MYYSQLFTPSYPPEGNPSASLETIETETLAHLVGVFATERDLPYSIELDPSNRNILTFSDCLGKTARLGMMCGAAGIPPTEMRIRTCRFDWRQFALPENIAQIAPTENVYHVYLELVLFYDMHGAPVWGCLDPTWDPKIGSILPGEYWDGEHPTTCAVLPLEEPNTLTLEEFLDTDWIDEDLSRNNHFYAELNAFLEQLRLQSTE